VYKCDVRDFALRREMEIPASGPSAIWRAIFHAQVKSLVAAMAPYQTTIRVRSSIQYWTIKLSYLFRSAPVSAS